MEDNSLKIEEMKLEYVKTLVTFILAVIGGEITVMQALFAESTAKFYVFLSTVFLLLGCLFCLSMSESIIRRISQPPESAHMKRIASLLPTSVTAEWYKSLIAGVTIMTGLLFFAFFVLHSI